MIRLLTIIAIFAAACGCTSTRRTAKTENKAALELESRQAARDSFVLEYAIDTSRECFQYLDYERVEYYDKTDSSGRQMVKAVVHRKAGRGEKKAGTTEAKAERVKADSTAQSIESIREEKIETTEEKTKPPVCLWWLLGVVLAISLAFWYYKGEK